MDGIGWHVNLANMTFGEKLAGIRKERGFSQADVAQAIQVEKSRVSNWENNKGKPTLENMMALSKFLGVSIDYLVFDNVPPEGVEAINDFELYEYFRKTETLSPEKKTTIKDVIDSIVFRERVKEIPEAQMKRSKESASQSLQKLAGKKLKS